MKSLTCWLAEVPGANFENGMPRYLHVTCRGTIELTACPHQALKLATKEDAQQLGKHLIGTLIADPVARDHSFDIDEAKP